MPHIHLFLQELDRLYHAGDFDQYEQYWLIACHRAERFFPGFTIAYAELFGYQKQWYAIEGSPVDADGYYDTDKEKVDVLFFGWVYSDFLEMGYFSLNEMEHIEVGGLGMERDLHFTPKRLSAVKKEQQ